MASTIQLTIDGTTISAEEGETLMILARREGFDIPGLCYLEGLSVVGACRLCMVEIEGMPRLMPACATRAAEGMKITTESDRLLRYRRMILELLLSERNHLCAVCVSNNHCELQALCHRLGVTHTRFPYRYPKLPVDGTHDRFVVDHNRCILCTRCVRVCNEIEGAHTWDVINRGIQSLVTTDIGTPWGESETCTGCGKCVQVCPTGALSEKGKAVGEMTRQRRFLPYLNQMREAWQ